MAFRGHAAVPERLPAETSQVAKLSSPDEGTATMNGRGDPQAAPGRGNCACRLRRECRLDFGRPVSGTQLIVLQMPSDGGITCARMNGQSRVRQLGAGLIQACLPSLSQGRKLPQLLMVNRFTCD